jgi:hypothetical protein
MRNKDLDREAKARIDAVVDREVRRWRESFYRRELGRIKDDPAKVAGVIRAARESGIELDGPVRKRRPWKHRS